MVFLAQRLRRSRVTQQPAERQLLGRCMHEVFRQRLDSKPNPNPMHKVFRQGLEASSDPNLQLSVIQFLSSYFDDIMLLPSESDPSESGENDLSADSNEEVPTECLSCGSLPVRIVMMTMNVRSASSRC